MHRPSLTVRLAGAVVAVSITLSVFDGVVGLGDTRAAPLVAIPAAAPSTAAPYPPLFTNPGATS
jgi:hypothetical protein